jgi:hypothetical protein
MDKAECPANQGRTMRRQFDGADPFLSASAKRV